VRPFLNSFTLHLLMAGIAELSSLSLEAKRLLAGNGPVTGITLPLQHRRMRDPLQKGHAV